MNNNTALWSQATTYYRSGQFDKAASIFLRLIALDPAHPGPPHMLGVIRAQQGHFQEALELIRSSLSIAPAEPQAYMSLGNVYRKLGQFPEALKSYEQAKRFAPSSPDILNCCGNALDDMGRTAEALERYERAISIHPRHVLAIMNRANALRKLSRYSESLDAYDLVLSIDRNNTIALLRRAMLLQSMVEHEKAVSQYSDLLKTSPDNTEALNNRGWSHFMLGNLEKAHQDFTSVLGIDSSHPGAHLNIGLHSLLKQNFRQGLPLYEWRKKLPEPVGLRHYQQKEWTGTDDISGKTIFVHAEQGIGDTIQFMRYVPFIQRRGAKVILAAPQRIHRLIKDCFNDVVLIGMKETPPAFDFHLSLMSAPLALGMFESEIPSTRSYMSAEPGLMAKWAEWLGNRGGLKIGIVWRGMRGNRGSEEKEFSLGYFKDISRLPGIRLISLQHGMDAEEITGREAGFEVEIPPRLDEGPDGFVDTAAIMSQLDLIICADAAPAHLAAALGIETWILLKKVPDWRWFLDSDSTPWYPTARLFRQFALKDWSTPFEEIKRDLVMRLQSPAG